MNKNIELSEVVILWGIDKAVQSLKNELKSKKIIVINPNEIIDLDSVDLHVKVKEQGDVFLAVMLSRFLFISDMLDIEFLDKYAKEYEEFYDFTQSFRIVLTLQKIGLDTIVIKNILELIDGKKTTIITGKGVSGQVEADDVKDSINALGILLGLFDKDGSGVFHLDKDGYQSGYDLSSGEFEFIDEIDVDILKEM